MFLLCYLTYLCIKLCDSHLSTSNPKVDTSHIDIDVRLEERLKGTHSLRADSTRREENELECEQFLLQLFFNIEADTFEEFAFIFYRYTLPTNHVA